MTAHWLFFRSIVLALSTALAAGCAHREEHAQERRAVRIAVPVPPSALSQVSNVIDALTTETLLGTEADGSASPKLATDWEWNGDRTLLKLKLRDDVLFHNGTPMSAQLVAESLRAGVQARDSLSFSSITAVDVTGDNAISVHLAAPDSFLLADLGNTSVTLPGHPEIATGPYRLAQRTPTIALDAFDKYYRGRPTIDAVKIEPYPTQRNAWAAMMRSEAEVLYEVSRDALDFVKAESAVKVYAFPRAYYYLLAFNLSNPVLKQRDVRLALATAVDKNAIVRDGMMGEGRPADSPIWPEYWALSSAAPKITFDPNAARTELDRAGFPVQHRHDGTMDRRFSFRCLVWADDARLQRIALLLQRQLFDVGVDMTLEPVTLRTLVGRAAKGDFDAFLFEFASVRSLSWVYTFWHSPTEQKFNFTGYKDADAVLDRIRRARDDDQVRAGVADLLALFKDDPPAVFLAWQTQARAVSSEIQVPAEPGRDIMSTVWQWKPLQGELNASR